MAVIWQLSALHTEKATLISGVVLKQSPFTYGEKPGSLRHLLKIFKTYFTKACKNCDIVVTVNGKNLVTRTDEHGSFLLKTSFPVNGKIVARLKKSGEALTIVQDYPVIFPYTQNSTGVITDMDDTVIISYTGNVLKRVRTLALVSPHKRKTIRFTEELIKFLQKNQTDIYYVSKSESNLFALLTTFLTHNELPKGVLFLTPYLSFGQLFKRKKGKAFKLNTIRFVLDNSPGKKFILFGDDTQKDMEVYTTIAKEYPEQIMKIYIRQTNRFINKTRKTYWRKLKEALPQSVYFNEETNLKNELAEINKLLSEKQTHI